MLTNNKKSCFVKGIAMMLAMLMVLAVCLTGCTDKTARDKADEAKTMAQETADKLTEALKGYLKTSDVEATVNALIKDALKDANTIKDFATSKQLDDLAAKLANYVAKDDLSATIKAELAKIDLAAALKDVMTADQIKRLVDEKLKDYYTKEEIDNRLKGYFGDLAPAEVLAALTAQVKGEGNMSEKEWNEATPVVLDAITKVQEILKKAENHTYLNDAKKTVNTALGIEVFKADAAGVYGDFDATRKEELTKYLEYRLLRVASLKEMEEFKASVDAANAVPTLESELAAIEARLLALGKNLNVLDAEGKITKYTADGKYRGVEVKNGAEVLVKVLTYADKAAFAAINADYDAVFVKYAGEGRLDGLNTAEVKGVYTTTAADIYDIWKVTRTVSGAVTVTYKLTKRAADALAKLPTAPVVADSTVAHVATTVDPTMFGYAAAEADGLAAPSTAVSAFGKVDLATATVAPTKVAYGDGIITDATAADAVMYVSAYKAALEQLKACEAAIKAANEKFADFLRRTVAADVTADADYKKLTDADLLGKLSSDMCEPNGTVVVDRIYLMEGVDPKTTNFVSGLMEASYKINGNDYIGIEKIELYKQMIAKSYDLLFPKYQQIAFNVLDQMEKDYKDLVARAAAGRLTGSTSTEGVGSIAQSGATEDSADYALGTFGYLFIKGTADLAEGESKTVALWKIGPTDYTFYGLENYYNNNEKAYIPKAPANQTGGVPGAETIKSNPLSSLKQSAVDININLGAATLAPRASIMSATAETLKSDKAVNKAFDDILQTALNNLNEVMNRYLLKDYKNATLNDLYAEAAKIADLYSITTTADAGVVGDIQNEVEKYLTGYSKSKDSYGFTYTTKDADKKVTGISSKNAKYGIAYASVKDALDKIDASKTAAIDGNNVAMVGTEAMNATNTVKTDATAMMEEFVIRKSFNAYLSHSKNALAQAQAKYAVTYMPAFDPNRFETYRTLQDAYNLALQQLTVTEYEANRGDIKMGEYKARLTGVLKLIVADAIDSTVGSMTNYDGMLTALKIDKTELKKAIKSSDVDVVAGEAVGQYKGLTKLDSYDWAGSAMVDFDKIVNADAAKKNADGTYTTKLY